MARLTIVLPLKGREQFSWRFINHAIELPYPVIMADGSEKPLVEKSFLQQFKYIRYPFDASLTHYHAKLADAVSKVNTPYAIIADNDDFIFRAGTERALDFLDANPDYVCAAGGLGGFSIYGNGANGKINRLNYRYTIHDRSIDIDSDNAIDRLCAGGRNWWSYYAVYRTEALQAITKEVKEIDFTDMQLHEFYCAWRALTLGKMRSDPTCISYMRQYGTSMNGFKVDWVHHMLRSKFNEEFTEIVSRISSHTENPAECHEVLLNISDKWLREFLHAYYGSLQTAKQFMRDHAPRFYNWLKIRRRFMVFRDRADLFRLLKQDGASKEYIKTFRAELKQMEALCQ